MIIIKPETNPIYFIVRSTNFSVIHYGCVPLSSVMSSGQEVLEEFDSRDELIGRLQDLNVEFDEDSIE